MVDGVKGDYINPGISTEEQECRDVEVNKQGKV